MKMIGKLFLLIVVSFLNFSFWQLVSAEWYGLHSVSFDEGGENYCDTDGQNDSGNSIPTNVNSSNYSSLQDEICVKMPGQDKCIKNQDYELGSTNGTMDCFYWDGKKPSISADNNSSDWKNENIDIELSVSDSGGAGLDISKYKWDDDSTICGDGKGFTNGEKITLSEEGEHVLYLCGEDNAGNQEVRSGVYKLTPKINSKYIFVVDYSKNLPYIRNGKYRIKESIEDIIDKAYKKSPGKSHKRPTNKGSRKGLFISGVNISDVETKEDLILLLSGNDLLKSFGGEENIDKIFNMIKK